MEIIEIETFLTIVDTRSISKTAEILFLTQPSVSHRLKSLETELGIQLLIREKGRKNIDLTSKGEDFLPIARQWLSLWQEAIALHHNQDFDFLSVGCTDSFSTLLAPLYRELLMGTPQIDIRIRTQQSNEIYDLLSAYIIDIGFVHHSLNYKNIIAEEILREDLFLIQPDHTPLKKEFIHTSELDPDYELFFSWEYNYQVWHDKCFGSMVRPRIQVDSTSLLDELWSDERIWMIAPMSIVRRIEKRRPVFICSLINKPPQRITYMLMNKNPKQSTMHAVELFQERIKKLLADWRT